MNIFTLPISEVSSENIYIMDPKKNILLDGTFSKMIYVNSFFSMNGIYMNLPIHIQKIENSNYFTKPPVNYVNNNTNLDTKNKTVPCSKKTVYFSVIKHNDLLLYLESLEKQILEKYIPLDSNIPKIYTILQTLKAGYFRVFRDSFSNTETSSSSSSTNTFVLKISGIWENAKGYGLSYKIVESNNV